MASVVACLAILAGTAACSESGVEILKPQERLRVATTTSLYDTGLWALLEPKFEEEYGVQLDILYAGTGIAIQYGMDGDVDMLAVHDKTRELKFIADGYGVERVPFAYNYFVLVGPADDPAGIKGLSPEAAFTKLAESKSSQFISRGDNSGTHSKEKAIWKSAGYEYTDIQASGSWYVEAGSGMGPTLVMAGEKNAYTLADIGTFLAYKGETGLASIVDEGSILLNVYSAIAVNPETITTAKAELAQQLIDFLVSEETQELIGNYGVKDYGQALFTPCAGNEPGATPATTTTKTGSGEGTGTATADVSSGYSVKITQGSQTLLDLSVADLDGLSAVNIVADGKDYSGPSLISLLNQAGITTFNKITIYGYSKGRVATAELVLTQAELTEQTILRKTNQNTFSMASPDIDADSWIIDVTEIKVE
jgi:tungstate transport system substrate-binding protein